MPRRWPASTVDGRDHAERNQSAIPTSLFHGALHAGRDESDRRHVGPVRSLLAHGDPARLRMRQNLAVADIFRRHGNAESHLRFIELLLNKPCEQGQ
jgi:hypothetical protein